MPDCPYCGSEEVEYEGIDDGGGDYGDSVCDQWFCTMCQNHFEDGCYGGGDPDDDDPPGGEEVEQLPTAVYFDSEVDDSIPF